MFQYATVKETDERKVARRSDAMTTLANARDDYVPVREMVALRHVLRLIHGRWWRRKIRGHVDGSN